MRLMLLIMFLSLLISGCERTDEIIVPTPPQTETTEGKPEEESATGEGSEEDDTADTDEEDSAEGEQADDDAEGTGDDTGDGQDGNSGQPPTGTASDNNTSGEDADSESYAYATFQNMPYRVLVPRNYDPSKSYPLHIFLHGIKERGFDNERQLTVGGEYFQRNDVREEYPAVIVFPQCPPSNYWFDNEIMKQLKDMIAMLQTKYAVDPDQISIGGYSMGAYGTFAFAARNPGFFRSAVAISGDGDEKLAGSMKKTKWRIFAGEKDKIVAASKTMKMVSALKKAGASVDFTLYPDADHGRTWIKAFSESDYFEWIFGD